jgi:predicted dehydrogenase
MNPIRWGILGGGAIAASRFIPAMAGRRAAMPAGIASRTADRTLALARQPPAPSVIEALSDSARTAQWQRLPG